MATPQIQCCFVIKMSVPSPRIHLVKIGPAMVSGKTEDLPLPACGTHVDVYALETEWGSDVAWMGHIGKPCGKCFPKKAGQ